LRGQDDENDNNARGREKAIVRIALVGFGSVKLLVAPDFLDLRWDRPGRSISSLPDMDLVEAADPSPSCHGAIISSSGSETTTDDRARENRFFVFMHSCSRMWRIHDRVREVKCPCRRLDVADEL
jgi:hypothetical protein